MRTKFLQLFILVSFISQPAKIDAQPINTQDSLALVDLYNSTNGNAWANRTKWLTPAPVSSWFGISVQSGRVIEINLDGNHVVGSLPSSIGNLSLLKTLSFNSNELNGTIPNSITNLTNLETISLNGNQLTGAIPLNIGNLTKLIYLQIATNQLSGSIPSSIGSLTKLSAIMLSGNQLTGNIPNSFGGLTTLYSLTFANNQLSGSIPSSFEGLINLRNLSLNINQFNGYVPAFLGNLPLNNLLLQNNQFIFSGLELIEQYYGSIANYSPQAALTLNNNNNLLSVSAGGSLSNNTYRWYKNGGLVATIAGDSTYAITSTGNYYVTVNNTIATRLTLTSNTIVVSALPLHLLDFKGYIEANTVNLKWKTSDEQHVHGFTIERTTDGINFIFLGKIAATNTAGLHSYTFQDTDQSSGTCYYRLMITEKDGQVSYSNIITIRKGKSNLSLSVYPNPIQQNDATIQFDALKNSSYEINITDLSGRLIKCLTGKYSIGRNKLYVNLSEFAKGTYLAILRDNDNAIKTVKITKL